MAKIKGVWKFNEVVSPIVLKQTVNFTTYYNTNEQTEIQIIKTDTGIRIMVIPRYVNIYKTETGWSDWRERVFDFGEIDQEVSDEFATWLFQNSNDGKITFPAIEGNVKVRIKDNGITTLATEKTYCDTDINISVNVQPKLQEKTTSESGEIVADEGYDGLFKVTVDIEEKIDEAFEAGKKSEYDRFWDGCQENGKRTNYQFGFSGNTWTSETFKPKYNITPIYGNDCFSITKIEGSLIEILNKLNVKIDLKEAYRIDGFFNYNLYITEIPELEIKKAYYGAGLTRFFSNCQKLETIEKLILPEDGSVLLGYDTFQACYSLRNIIIEGKIEQIVSGYKILYLKDSIYLSKNSIISIINALSLNSAELTISFSLSAVNNAFETSSGAADGSTSEEWAALVATKPNWTISLV